MKALLVIALLVIASTSYAETWKDQEVREASEREESRHREELKLFNIKQNGGRPISDCEQECYLNKQECYRFGGNAACQTQYNWCIDRCQKPH